MPLRVALTIDDAPSAMGPGLAFAPERMDGLREVLRRAGVRHCVAFVIGERARGQQGPLERWLSEGFELGNHGEDHVAASARDTAAFARAVESCHALLESLGAFGGGRRRYFRPPFGDRGRSPEQRAEVARVWEGLGYAPADVSVDLYDWLYEEPLAQALQGGDAGAAARVVARHRRAALRELRGAQARTRARLGKGWVQIAACHFGEVSLRGLEPLLARLREVEWCPLAAAVDRPGYGELAADLRENGILGDRLSRGPMRGALRRGSRWLVRAGFLDQIRLGPVWPRWSG